MSLHLESPKKTIISEMSSHKVEQRRNVYMTDTRQCGGRKEDRIVKKRKMHSSWPPSHQTCPFPVPTDTVILSGTEHVQPRQKIILNVAYVIRKRETIPSKKL